MNTVAQTVGANVRRLRRSRGLSLISLGQNASIAKGTLTQLESGRGNPTLETIDALARALGVSVVDLLAEHDDALPMVVRADEGTTVPDRAYEGQLLFRSQTGGSVTELFRIRLAAGQRASSAGHAYGVIEQVYVLAGTATVGPRNATVTVGAHDFVQFHADGPHVYRAHDHETVLLLWMLYPSPTVETTADAAPSVASVAPAGVLTPGRPPRIPARGQRPRTGPRQLPRG